MTYSASDFPPFAVTVDLAILTLRANSLSVLLITRGEDPFRGMPALPGGFVRVDESAEAAAARELAEETGVTKFRGHVEHWPPTAHPGETLGCEWCPSPLSRLLRICPSRCPDRRRRCPVGRARGPPGELAFDHQEILDDAVERVRAKLEYTTLATQFVGSTFTLRDLQTVYEAVWDTTWDRANFRRKVLGTPDFVRPVEGRTASTGTRGRNAQLYRAGRATALHPPILRA